MLAYIYGSDYKTLLGGDLIKYSSESTSEHIYKLLKLTFCLAMLSTNLAMQIQLNPLFDLWAYLTNWILIATLICTVLAIFNNLVPCASRSQTWLALTHILYSYTLVINVLGKLAYWGVMHAD